MADRRKSLLTGVKRIWGSTGLPSLSSIHGCKGCICLHYFAHPPEGCFLADIPALSLKIGMQLLVAHFDAQLHGDPNSFKKLPAGQHMHDATNQYIMCIQCAYNIC